MRKFTTIFMLGLLAFALANGLSYFARSDSSRVSDGFRAFGFPFMVWREGGIAGISEFSQAGLSGNVVVAVLSSAVAGVLWNRFRKIDR